jgi:hypothetical protein
MDNWKKDFDIRFKVYQPEDLDIFPLPEQIPQTQADEVKLFIDNLIADLKDKLSRRNMQIKDLKVSIETLKEALSKKQDVITKLANHPMIRNISNKDMEKYLTL